MPNVFVTCGRYNTWDPRWGLQRATVCHWANIADNVYQQPGYKPEHQRERYINAMLRSRYPFVTISDDDCLLRPMTGRHLHSDVPVPWHEYVQDVFDRHPEIGYLGPWRIPDDGRTPSDELKTMMIVGGVRFIRKGCLDPDDMLPMLDGKRGYDMQIAKMLQTRGWKCALMTRLKVHHLGRGFSIVDPKLATYTKDQ